MKLKSILSAFILLVFCNVAKAQEIIEQKYYKSRYGKEVADEKKAKFISLTTTDSGNIVHYVFKNIKHDKILESRNLKDDVPIGLWIEGERRLDYSFELIYNNLKYDNVDYVNLTGTPLNRDIIIPELGDKSNVLQFLKKNVRYPALAVEREIKGRVLIQFIVDEAGQLDNISIYKGVHPILDKEVMRLFRESGRWIPAQRNGKPVKVATIVPVTFLIN